jgi:hypothetical protein
MNSSTRQSPLLRKSVTERLRTLTAILILSVLSLAVVATNVVTDPTLGSQITSGAFPGTVSSLHAVGSPTDKPTVNLTSGPNMNIARMSHYTTLLADGRVAVLGGHGQGFVTLTSLEVWNTGADAFAVLNMPYTLDGGALVRLADGRFLTAGGAGNLGNAPGHNNAQIYDPVGNTVTALSAALSYRRCNCTGPAQCQ